MSDLNDCKLVVKHVGHLNKMEDMVNLLKEIGNSIYVGDSENDTGLICIWCLVGRNLLSTVQLIKNKFRGTIFEKRTSFSYCQLPDPEERLHLVPDHVSKLIRSKFIRK
jgi:hypothetical protein